MFSFIGGAEYSVAFVELSNAIEPQLIKAYDTEEEAMTELKKYNGGTREFMNAGTKYIEATDYYVEEITVDEDGEIEDYSGNSELANWE